jgi:F1F0 ATPase subunit 2
MFDTTETLLLVAAVVTGALLGGLYFGGLWWTLRCMPRARHPLKLYFGSTVVRLAVLLAALHGVLTYLRWPLLLASLGGFIAIRFVLIGYLGPTLSVESPSPKGI